jgi:uncharacterized membrane protein YhaH (DUF805 family)
MSDVFISYAREDNAQAERIARGLEAQGLSVFWDNEIPPGQTWADYIEDKLNKCSVAIVLWSEHSTKSQWVREEARMGRSKLIPAKLDASEAPFGFGDVQAADLSHWGGDYNHPEWGRFSGAVVTKVRGGEAPLPPSTEPPPQTSGWQAQPPLQHQSQTGWQSPPPNPQQNWNANTSAQPNAVALTPLGYIQKCFRLYVDGKGRARRAEFWWWILFTFVLGLITGSIDFVLSGGATAYGQIQVLSTIVGLVVLAPSISVMSRRLHDSGQNGWLAAAPIVLSGIAGAVGMPTGSLFSLLAFAGVIAIGVLPGTVGPNAYGPDPKAP